MKLPLFAAGLIALVSAAGTVRNPHALHGGLRAAANSVQKRPTYIYVDHWESSLEHSDFVNYIKDLVNAGASHVLLAFVVPGAGDALDSTGQFDRLTAAERAELKSFMASKNAKLIMSIGGGNYGNAFVKSDATATASQWCGHAADQGYDGVDWDLEGFTARSKDHPEMEWIKTAVDVCHKYVPLVSHAPQAPNIGLFSNYAFEGVIEASTDPTDRFLIQYYNQPTAPYTDFVSLYKSDTEFFASITEIEKRVPSAKGKLVLGKYMYGFGGTGEMPADDLVKVLEQAEASGYTGGVMIWKSPAKGTPQLAQLLNTDLPKLAGLGAAPVPTRAPSPATTRAPTPRTTKTIAPRPTVAPTRAPRPVPTRAPTPETTEPATMPIRKTTTAHVSRGTTASSEMANVSCAGVKAYDGSVFMRNEQAVFEDALWEANWYAQNPPSTSDLAWTKVGECEEVSGVQPCASPQWDADVDYSKPSEVSHDGGIYRNKWYVEAGDEPSRTNENWQYLGACSGSGN